MLKMEKINCIINILLLTPPYKYSRLADAPAPTRYFEQMFFIQSGTVNIYHF